MIELTDTDHAEIDRLRGMANEDDDERVLLHAIYRAGLAAGHCRDCCCARSWEALGITEYDGRSIPEHITTLRERIAALEAERDALRKTLAGIAPTLPGATIGPTTYYAPIKEGK